MKSITELMNLIYLGFLLRELRNCVIPSETQGELTPFNKQIMRESTDWLVLFNCYGSTVITKQECMNNVKVQRF